MTSKKIHNITKQIQIQIQIQINIQICHKQSQNIKFIINKLKHEQKQILH